MFMVAGAVLMLGYMHVIAAGVVQPYPDPGRPAACRPG